MIYLVSNVVNYEYKLHIVGISVQRQVSAPMHEYLGMRLPGYVIGICLDF